MTGCGKQSFPTPAEASKSARWLRRNKSRKVAPYRCALCKSWHLGHGL